MNKESGEQLDRIKNWKQFLNENKNINEYSDLMIIAIM